MRCAGAPTGAPGPPKGTPVAAALLLRVSGSAPAPLARGGCGGAAVRMCVGEEEAPSHPPPHPTPYAASRRGGCRGWQCTARPLGRCSWVGCGIPHFLPLLVGAQRARKRCRTGCCIWPCLARIDVCWLGLASKFGVTGVSFNSGGQSIVASSQGRSYRQPWPVAVSCFLLMPNMAQHCMCL